MQEKDNMITNLYIENFLSLEKVEIGFSKLNLLVGPNAGGKSNIVKALSFLSKLTNRGVPEICKELGIENTEHLIFNFEKERRLKLRVGLKIEDTHMSYEVGVTSEGRIQEETIKSKNKTFLIRQRGETKASYLTDLDERSTFGAGSVIISALPYLPENANPLTVKTRDFLKGFQTYSFDPYEMRSVTSSGFELGLDAKGKNLAQVLHTLVTFNRRKFLEIEETMKKLIPEIEEINVPTTKGGDKVYLAIRERKISEPLKYANISDGTLRVLAFVTALSLGGSLVAFEEPENCVHPYLFETVLDLCRKAPTQVIITTHSPYLVDKVKLEELYIVTKGEGKTIVRKIKGNEKRKVKRILNEGLTLGEIWYSGELGGIPHE